MDEVLAIIDDALKRKGLTDAAASKLAVGHPSLIKNLRMPREGEKRYNLPALQKLAEVLDLELYFGPRRPAPPRLVSARPVGGLSDPSTAVADQLVIDATRAGYATMPWHFDFRQSGPMPVAFSRAWMEQMKIVPDNLRVVAPDDVLVCVPGPGSVLALIDTAERKPWSLALWCYAEGRRVVLAELQGAAKTLVIRNADRIHPDRILTGPETAALRVLGRVVWWGRLEPAPPPDAPVTSL